MHLINKPTNTKYIHKYTNYHFKVDEINQQLVFNIFSSLLSINTLKLSKSDIEIARLSNITLKHPNITENYKTYSIIFKTNIIIVITDS